jgi:serine/threonine protein kinase
VTAAEKLVGLALPSGWQVTKKIAKSANGTGGMFSCSYEVHRGKEIGFLKAFDFAQAFEPGVDTPRVLEQLTAAFNFELSILEHCRNRRLTRVVLAIDHGHVDVPGMGPIEGRVFYLIFELAQGDVRCQIDLSTAQDAYWCLLVLKDVSLGLWQVHRESIAHQDVKPSNVLAYPDEQFKIADFGRASRKGQSVWHDEVCFAGDRGYAPLELIYGFTHPDFGPRRVGCDLFMLGNLVAFLFSGVNLTTALLSELAPEHHPNQWNASYSEVLPYLQDAFARVLEAVAPRVDSSVRAEVMQIIRELGNPDLAKRGHPRGVGRYDQYSLERYVSRFNLLAQELPYHLKRRSA